MAADLPMLQGRLDAAKAAMARGAKSVSYGDWRKESVSVDDWLKIIKDIETDIALLGGGPTVTRTYRFHSHKGL